MINHSSILPSTTHTSRWNHHRRTTTTARSALSKPNSKNHSRRGLTSRTMTSSRETRPPQSRKIYLLSLKIYHTRRELSSQLVSFNKFNLSNFVWWLSTPHDTPRDRVSFCDQLKHASGRVSSHYLAIGFLRSIREFCKEILGGPIL